MNRNHYTRSSHEWLCGDVCLSTFRRQVPPSQSSQRREEAKGQYGLVRGVRSDRVADTSPECQKRELKVAGAAGATRRGIGEAQAGDAALVVRARMVSNGWQDDRRKPCIVLYGEVVDGRIHTPETKRCKGSDRPIVAMTPCESTEEACRMGTSRSGPEPKTKDLRRGLGQNGTRSEMPERRDGFIRPAGIL
jgi:hypothetical protein